MARSAARPGEEYMRRALRLARRGLLGVSPNPMVGAVLVRGGRIAGEGFHRRFGGPHAEVEAIRAAGTRARGADLYISLEPCGHHGKTPPCAEAIARAGIARVFYAIGDPNPLTRGLGLRFLRARGIALAAGLCRDEAASLNAPYFHWRRTGRPWVIVKWAMSLDGKIATRAGASRWITGDAARRHAHDLRRRVDAVLAGTETARLDDPWLAPRPARGRRPLRVVLDRRGRLPLSLRLLAAPAATRDAGRTVVVASRRAPARRRRLLEARGARVLVVAENRHGGIDLEALLRELGGLEVSQLLVEGGGALAGSFLDAGLVDEAVVYVAPRLVGGREARGAVGGVGVERLEATPWLVQPAIRRLGEDFVIEGRVRRRR